MERKFYIILNIVAVIILALIIIFKIDSFKVKSNFIYEIKNGSNISVIARELEQNNAISVPFLFKITGKIMSILGIAKIKYGEFEIKKGTNFYDMIRIFSSTRFFLRSVTFPEGLTIKEMLEIINNSSIKGEKISTHGLKEGYLMPETYSYTSFETKKKIIEKMTQEMHDFLEETWKNNKNDQLKSEEELLILASIVEKETGIDEERDLVSSVFTNRLKQGMKLQSDPTIIYEVTKGQTNFNRPITKKDIQSGHIYNTYKIKGLPPTPISCPSRKSIISASKKTSSNYIYFVAIGDKSNRHYFSTTYPEHLKNIEKYKENLRNKN